MTTELIQHFFWGGGGRSKGEFKLPRPLAPVEGGNISASPDPHLVPMLQPMSHHHCTALLKLSQSSTTCRGAQRPDPITDRTKNKSAPFYFLPLAMGHDFTSVLGQAYLPSTAKNEDFEVISVLSISEH